MDRRKFVQALGAGALCCWAQAMYTPAMAYRATKGAQKWRGFNLLNYFNADYMQPFREEEWQWMHEWGFNFVRLPLSYWCWSRPGDYYHMDERVLADLDHCVEWARKYRIHVCINLHRAPGYCVNPPAEPENIFESARALDGCAHQWAVLAQRYASVPARWLSFNLLNEVANVKDSDYERVVRHLVKAIRQYSPGRLIMIDGLDWGCRPLTSVGDLDNIIQCGRGYQPMLISHYEASWVFGDKPMALPRHRLSWPLEADGLVYDRTYLRNLLQEAWKPLLEQGRQPVFIGEFGSHNRTPHPVALAWLKDNLDVFHEMDMGWSLWNLKGSFGILDSGRDDVDYEDFHGHRLDRAMLDLLRKYL